MKITYQNYKGLIIILILLVGGTLIELQLQKSSSTIFLNSDYADFIFYNGTIISVDDNFTEYEAIAIQENLILGLGNDDIITDQFALEEQTQMINLNGKAILPGFINSHSHMLDLSRFNEYGIDGSQDLALSYGWTTNVEKYGKEDIINILQTAENDGELKMRVNVFASYNEASLNENNETIILESWFPNNTPIIDPESFFRIPGIKIFSDGSFSPERGAWALSEPMPDFDMNTWVKAITTNPYGDLYLNESYLLNIVNQAHEMGYQVAFHSMGDRAIETVVDVIETVTMGDNSDYRHQIEHSSYLRHDLMERYVDIGIYASLRGIFPTCLNTYEIVQNFFSDNYFNTSWYANRYNMHNNGVEVYLEADFGWTHEIGDQTESRNLDPFLNIHGLVTRSNIAENGTICTAGEWLHPTSISLEEALRMITIQGAKAIKMENFIGSLELGKFADFVVVAQSPFELPEENLKDMYAIITVVNGEIVYEIPMSDLILVDYQTSISTTRNVMRSFNAEIITLALIPTIFIVKKKENYH